MNRFLFGTLFLLGTVVPVEAGDPNPDVILSATSAVGAPGATGVAIHCLLDNATTNSIAGWSWGLCDNSTDVMVTEVLEGQTTLTVNGGAPPAFHAPSVMAAGWTVGVVINFFGDNPLAPGSDLDLEVASYDVSPAALAGTAVALNYCSTLGEPLVFTTIVFEGGESANPTTVPGVIEIPDCNFLRVGTETGLVGGSVDVAVELENCVDVAGLQIALTYDGGLVSSAGADPVGGLASAEFYEVVDDGAQLIIGAVLDFDAPLGDNAPIPAGAGAQAVVMTHWDIPAATPAPSSSPLNLVDGVGNPVIDTLIVQPDGSTVPGTRENGAIDIVNFNPFIRGNCNDDDIVNIADAVFTLNFLFVMGDDPRCDDACDSNDDGMIDSADAVYTLNYRFLGGPEPTAPFPDPDLDPTTGDGLGCDGDADDL